MQTRRYWFGTHLGILGLSTFAILKSQSVGIYFAVLLVAMTAEIWLLTRSFRTGRSATRFGCLFAMLPTTLFLALVAIGIAAIQFAEAENQAHAQVLNLQNVVSSPKTQFLEISGTYLIRGDLAGYFFAPNSSASSWWMVPVVTPGWTPQEPVKVWMLTTDRTKEKDIQGQLHYAKVERKPLGIRAQSALDDALAYFKLQADPDPIVIIRANELRESRKDAEATVALATMGCLIGWLCCACYWPKSDANS